MAHEDVTYRFFQKNVRIEQIHTFLQKKCEEYKNYKKIQKL